MNKFILITIAIITIGACAFMGISLEKNKYKFIYEDLVKQTIKETVKSECLK
jgi:hypothetical protein